jgi:hypothetical protein
LSKEVAVKINNASVQYPVKWDITSIDTTKAGTNLISGTLENTDKRVKITVIVIAVASIENINSKVNLNDKYALPSKVTAKMTDSSTREVDVTWSPSSADTSKAGNFKFEGTVSGYNSKVQLTLNVVAIASIDNISSSIKQNDKYSLPAKVAAKMTDGTTREVEVAWSPTSVDTSKAGSFNYEGTVSGYNNKVKLTLNIKSTQSDDDYTPEMAVQLAKEHEGAGNSDDVDGAVWNSYIKNGKKYYWVHLYSKSMRAQGGTGTIDNIVIAKDGSTINSWEVQ